MFSSYVRNVYVSLLYQLLRVATCDRETIISTKKLQRGFLTQRFAELFIFDRRVGTGLRNISVQRKAKLLTPPLLHLKRNANDFL